MSIQRSRAGAARAAMGTARVAALRVAAWVLAAGVLLAPAAQAATRAWLDRNVVAQGEAVTLNIETDQPGAAPDYTPLQADFELGPPYRGNGAGDRTLFGVALTPRRDGALQVPALQVGGERTAPLALRVTAPRTAAVPGGDVFIEARVDDPAPYVQQSVGLTLRLYYATPLLSGELTQPVPDGASLQRVGEDVQSSREIGGRRYHLVERRYLLVPERSGPLPLPPARFSGQGAGGFFDDFFGTDRNLSAEGQAQTLQVRAQPDGAPQPWLPLRDLRLRYLSAPSQARAGEAVEIAVEAVAQGATAAQFPEIPVPQATGAQVFAERAETTERFVDGSPQLTVVRRFSVVPLQAGPLQVAGPRMDWWDTVAGRAQVATLPGLPLQVAAGAAATATPGPVVEAPRSAPQATPAGDGIAPAPLGGIPLLWLAILFAVLWLGTLGWVLWLRRGRPAGVGIGGQSPPDAADAQPRPTLAELRRALDADGFDTIVRLLQRMAVPPASDLDAVIARLDDAGQRAALEAMRRALWGGGGDVSAARARLRGAFREGPRWKAAAPAAAPPLPPLYPPR